MSVLLPESLVRVIADVHKVSFEEVCFMCIQHYTVGIHSVLQSANIQFMAITNAYLKVYCWCLSDGYSNAPHHFQYYNIIVGYTVEPL